jgi:DNA-binding NarL/FixJ family response regulator
MSIMNIILADNQDITRAGLLYILQKFEGVTCSVVTDKSGLAYRLKDNPQSVVILDYSLFDIQDEAELQVFGQRFREAFLILFCEDLSTDFVRRQMAVSSMTSILLKDSPMGEIRECISDALKGHRYICQHMMEMLLAPAPVVEEKVRLTKTETEILKDIATGMTTKEIAEKRFSSFHTVNTHRKNIFRKLSVNNVHEATRYALRAGLVDSAEYYI